jgi:signal transduction histidine kinase
MQRNEALRILLVDDDQVDRMAVRRSLRAGGVTAEVTDAVDVASALAAAQGQPFDCVLLDYNLPGGDGLRVLRGIRGAGLDVPVIMLSGQQDTQTAVGLMKEGASDYLAKDGLTPERLAQSLRHAVRLHHAEAQARDAVQARSRFYAVMSHELRTPINAILGYNDLVLAGVYGPLDEGVKVSIERAQRATRHLLELVNDVLDLSKLEAGKMEVAAEPVNVPQLIEELLSTVGPVAESSGTALDVSEDGCRGPIITDPRRVRQILLNLVSNAIKFGAGKPVKIRCNQRDAGWMELEVADMGMGIPAEDLPRIFDEFVQLPNSAEGGTGLGLPISRRLAQLLGGELQAESTPGAGSLFRLRLPAVHPDSVAAAAD